MTQAHARPEPPSEELVLKRNAVERLKREKSPLGILGELPALIATGYADVAEEDIVRLKWWGLYHDKPKVGTFMLRVKLPAGRVLPSQLRVLGELSNEFGRGAGELSTRQTVQLHHLTLGSLPEVFARLEAAGLTTAGACGDAVRNVTGCPLAGIAGDEVFDVTGVVDEVTSFFYGNPDYSNLPRKHKISISACAHRCNAPEINCISLVGAVREGTEGFAVLVGGGLASVPRLARELGAFVVREDVLPVLRALLDTWQEDLRYRLSRVKSRMKFMVDDYGPEGVRAEVERRLGRALPDFRLPPHPGSSTDHLGLVVERDGFYALGIPVHVGLVTGDRLRALADVAEVHGRDVRVTRQQNLVLTGIVETGLPEVQNALRAAGFDLDASTLRGASIACTGEPHCNYSVTETKTRLASLIETLEDRFGTAVGNLRLNLDGCPHACGQHWVGDIGFQGSTVRDADGARQQAYELYLRGGLGPDAAIGRPLFRRVATTELDETVGGLVAAWIAGRADGESESFASWATRSSDDELAAAAGRPVTVPRGGRSASQGEETE